MSALQPEQPNQNGSSHLSFTRRNFLKTTGSALAALFSGGGNLPMAAAQFIEKGISEVGVATDLAKLLANYLEFDDAHNSLHAIAAIAEPDELTGPSPLPLEFDLALHLSRYALSVTETGPLMAL